MWGPWFLFDGTGASVLRVLSSVTSQTTWEKVSHTPNQVQTHITLPPTGVHSPHPQCLEKCLIEMVTNKPPNWGVNITPDKTDFMDIMIPLKVLSFKEFLVCKKCKYKAEHYK